MTELEILDELTANDKKIIRALVEKVSLGMDDTRLVDYNVRQEELRAMLQEIRNAVA